MLRVKAVQRALKPLVVEAGEGCAVRNLDTHLLPATVARQEGQHSGALTGAGIPNSWKRGFRGLSPWKKERVVRE